jgi:serine phosphatase RsbU (regulator of sigma subunit)
MSFFTLKVNSQETPQIDSLQNLLVQHTKEDTVKVNLFLELVKYYGHNENELLINAEKALKLSNKLNFEKGQAKSLLYLGNYYHYYKSEYTLAIDFLKKSLKISKKLNDKLAISKALNNIGIIYDVQGDYVQALEYYQKALEKNQEIGNQKGISHSLNNIGVIYNMQSDYEQALLFYHKSLDIDIKNKNDRSASISLINIGRIYTLQHKYDTAFSYFEQSLEIAKRIENDKVIGQDLYYIGLNYQEQKEYKQALEFFDKALMVNQKTNNQYIICSIYTNIGAIHLDKKEYEKALSYTKKSLELASKMELLERKREIHKQFSQIYEETNKYEKAYRNYKIYKLLNDSLFNEKNVKKVTSLELQYKYDKEKQAIALEQAKKDAIQEVETKEQNKLRNSLIMGILLTILLVFAAIYGFIQKRKANTILAQQKQRIENTNEELNIILETVNQQKETIEQAHQKTQASISYASRIQQALLPSKKLFSTFFPEHFILFKPKDIVSGDFYYLKKVNNFLVIAVADCTGHGVPGAFVSLLGISFLNEIVVKKEVRTAADILEDLRQQVKVSLRQIREDSQSKDGMDIALCVLDTRTNLLQFAGAYNPLYIIRNKELIEVKGTRSPVGIHIKEKNFENHEIQLQKSDSIYLISDGYIDQFGGDKGMKFMAKRFKNSLLEIAHESCQYQKELLNNELKDWMKDEKQIDDITVLGFKI